MEHAVKLGLGLFLVLSSLVYFVWKLAYYKPDCLHKIKIYLVLC